MPISRKDEQLLIGLLQEQLADVADQIRIRASSGSSGLRILKAQGGSIAWVKPYLDIYRLTPERGARSRPTGRGWREQLADILETHTRSILGNGPPQPSDGN